MVHRGRPPKFTKHLEKMEDFFLTNAFAIVHNLPFQQLCTFVVGQEYTDLSSSTKLKSIFYQVDQDLFESNMVSFKTLGQLTLRHQLCVVPVFYGLVQDFW
jgi:hypothetical protein